MKALREFGPGGEITFEHRDTVGFVTLNRPERRNALSPQINDALAQAFQMLAVDPSIRVVVLRGAGPSFCAGADLRVARDPESRWAIRRHQAGAWQRLLDQMERLPQVTVAVLHGHVIGGGVLLAAACDLRLADETVQLRIPELAIGLPLTWAGSPLLAREVGLSRAREWVMTGRSIAAAEAFDAGFVQRLAPAGFIETELETLIGELTAAPSGPLSLTTSPFRAISATFGRRELGWADADLLSWSVAEPESQSAAADYVERRLTSQRSEQSVPDVESIYRRDGGVTIEDLVPHEVLETAREVTDLLLDEANRCGEDSRFDRDPDGAVRRINNPTFVDTVYDQIMRSEPLLEVVRRLIGNDVRFHSAKLNIKQPGRGAIEWHQDFAFFPHTNDDLVAVGVALDDTTIENGCLQIVSGTHHGEVLDHHDSSGRFVGAVKGSEAESIGRPLPLPVRAGGATFHHVRTLHGSAPNSSDQPRRVLFLQYAAADAFPLTYQPALAAPDLRLLERLIVSGRPSTRARLTNLVVDLPLFDGTYTSIYASQGSLGDRAF